jgi:hypothetical protein
MLDYLRNPTRPPTYIAEFQPTSVCDPTGMVDTILTSSYRQVAVVGSVPILERMGHHRAAPSR